MLRKGSQSIYVQTKYFADLTDLQELPRLVRARPIRDGHTLWMSWQLPPQLQHYQSFSPRKELQHVTGIFNAISVSLALVSFLSFWACSFYFTFLTANLAIHSSASRQARKLPQQPNRQEVQSSGQ